MKAAVFKQAGQPLVIETRPDPTPGENGVVIKVARCGICSSDLHVTEGHGMTAETGSVLGHEFAGEVVAVGSGVTNYREGDRVTALPLQGCGQCPACLEGEARWCKKYQMTSGGYAEYVLANSRSCKKLPTNLTLADGALVEPLAVALNGVMLADIQPGANVLVLGAGPIGLATAWWAQQAGAKKVAVMATSRRRAVMAEKMGVTDFIVSDGNERRAIKERLGGLPDIVFECVGFPGMIKSAIDYVKPRGTVLVVSFCLEQDSFYPAAALTKEVKMQFALMYNTGHFVQAINQLDAGKIEPRAMITETVSLNEFPETFELLRGKNPHCKVQLNPWC